MMIIFSPLDPIKALFWTAIINGLIAVPVMVMMMLVAANKKVMSNFTVDGVLKYIGWIGTAVMAAASIGMGVTSVIG